MGHANFVLPSLIAAVCCVPLSVYAQNGRSLQPGIALVNSEIARIDELLRENHQDMANIATDASVALVGVVAAAREAELFDRMAAQYGLDTDFADAQNPAGKNRWTKSSDILKV